MAQPDRGGDQLGGHDSNRGTAGLFDSVRTLLSTLVGIAHTRLELLSAELQEELSRAAFLILWSAVALFFAFLGIAFLGVVVIIAFWDDHRLLAAGLLTALFVALAIIFGIAASRQIGAKPRPFDASLRELTKDRDELAPKR
ncbi:MAG: hypothetical protein C5B46_01745 [Proteobacteria bacterium]|nr:MAG: hypothetical protein C5B46_01745 [Pseudomonadota bacterium]